MSRVATDPTVGQGRVIRATGYPVWQASGPSTASGRHVAKAAGGRGTA